MERLLQDSVVWDDLEFSDIGNSPQESEWWAQAKKTHDVTHHPQTLGRRLPVLQPNGVKRTLPECVRDLLENGPKESGPNRNKNVMALAGFLRDAGYDYRAAEELLKQWTRRFYPDPRRLSERLANAKSVLKSAFSGRVRSGCAFIRSCSGPRAADAVRCVGDQKCEWGRRSATTADTGSPERHERSRIYKREDLARETDDAEAAIVRYPGIEIFSRGTALVHVKSVDDQVVVIPSTTSGLRDAISRAAEYGFLKEGEDGKARFVKRRMPSDIAQSLESRGSWDRIPPLRGIARGPVLKPGYEILSNAGYDKDTGLYLDKTLNLSVGENPTLEDAQRGLEFLLHPFQDFLFSEPEKTNPHAAILAAIFTMLARPAIDGTVPGFAVAAPVQGAAKGLLVNAIHMMVNGRPSRMTPPPTNEEEFRKKILALGLTGEQSICIDNVHGVLKSASLALAMTSRTFSDRLLGKSLLLTVPMDVVWFVTGNGLLVDADLARRFLPIYLDPGRSDPEKRTGFKYPRLLESIQEMRPRLLEAAFTILRAYHAAGEPPHPWAALGGFEEWDRLVRGAIHWVGLGDACASRERLRLEDNLEVEFLVEALVCWRELLGAKPMTAADVVKCCAEDPAADGLRHALLSWAPPKSGNQLRAYDLGYALRRAKGRVAAGMKFVAEPTKRSGTTLWRVAGTPDESAG